MMESLDIIAFIEHADLLNDQSSSISQKTCLKAIYGLPLDPQELEIYKRATGRQTYDAAEQQEVTIIAGRRSGKTTKIAARIVCFEAVRDHGLPQGEEGYVMLLAPTLKQAKIAFRAIHRDLRRSPVLSAWVVRTTKDEIELKNGIIIGCYACTYDGVRGHSVVAAVCDELGFWSDEDTAANPAEEVIAALMPGMATVRNSKLVKISTPFRKDGVLWREFQQRAELDFAVWQLSSQEMNPTISSSILERERDRSAERFRREFLAEFTDSVSGWIVPELLDPCIVRGRTELPYTSDGIFVAVADPAFVRDDFALAILSRRDDGRIVVHRVARWSGTKAAPLGHEDVLGQVKSILSEYQLNSLIGDRHCYDLIRQLPIDLVFTIRNTISTRGAGRRSSPTCGTCSHNAKSNCLITQTCCASCGACRSTALTAGRLISVLPAAGKMTSQSPSLWRRASFRSSRRGRVPCCSRSGPHALAVGGMVCGMSLRTSAGPSSPGAL